MAEIKIVDVSQLPKENKDFKGISLPFYKGKAYGVMDLDAYQAHIISIVGGKNKEDAGLVLKFKGFTDDPNVNTTTIITNPNVDVYFSNPKRMFVFKDGNTFYLQHGTLSATYNDTTKNTVRQDKTFLNNTTLYSYNELEGGIMAISIIPVQTTGDSTEDVMSQKSVTDYLRTKVDKEQAFAVFASKDDLNNELQIKQDKLVSGNNIKTINGESLLGYTDIKLATPSEIVITQTLIQQVAEAKANKSDIVGKKYSPEGGEVFNNYEDNIAMGIGSHAEGNYTTAYGNASHAEGSGTNAFGIDSHAEGFSSSPADQTGINISSATDEKIIGQWNSSSFALVKGTASHVEGIDNLVLGEASHAEGKGNIIEGSYSHASGKGCGIKKCWQNKTNGALLFTPPAPEEASNYTLYKGDVSFVAGLSCMANGDNAVSIGANAIANPSSFSIGLGTKSYGTASFSTGIFNQAYNFAQASFGIGSTHEPTPSHKHFDQTKRLFCVGNGLGLGKFSDALKMLGSGETWLAGALHEPQADYAEMFEWMDGNPKDEDRVGYFVTMKDDKIVKAKSADKYILGIVSAAPAIIGDNPNLWHGQYINDEWGRPIYEDVEVKYTDYETNEKGETIEVEKTRTDHIRKINPKWDTTKPYVDRTQRKEWDAIGLMGKLLVRQDGTLKAGDFCKPNDKGIATKSDNGYYVMKVNNKNQALIMFK